MVQFNKSKIAAIRHVITPYLNFKYTPDFSTEKYGYYKTVQSDTLGNTQQYSIMNTGVYGSPSKGKTGNITFGFSNILEMKTRSKKDTIEIVEWGEKPKVCDVIINTTSVGLTKGENLDLDFKDYKNNKNVLFYDLIYNPKETNFLKDARLRGNKTMNGKMMFLWQAQIAFQMWTKVCPEIDDEAIKLLD